MHMVLRTSVPENAIDGGMNDASRKVIIIVFMRVRERELLLPPTTHEIASSRTP